MNQIKYAQGKNELIRDFTSINSQTSTFGNDVTRKYDVMESEFDFLGGFACANVRIRMSRTSSNFQRITQVSQLNTDPQSNCRRRWLDAQPSNWKLSSEIMLQKSEEEQQKMN